MVISIQHSLSLKIIHFYKIIIMVAHEFNPNFKFFVKKHSKQFYFHPFNTFYKFSFVK